MDLEHRKEKRRGLEAAWRRKKKKNHNESSSRKNKKKKGEHVINVLGSVAIDLGLSLQTEKKGDGGGTTERRVGGSKIRYNLHLPLGNEGCRKNASFKSGTLEQRSNTSRLWEKLANGPGTSQEEKKRSGGSMHQQAMGDSLCSLAVGSRSVEPLTNAMWKIGLLGSFCVADKDYV
ncbi:hypothetical protein CEXT_55311 [Caerostris extrusa]|uniref:Uncharacterized protein n=1 Tax=Caerostris extrusa TaxID=172846 RepID=A0AAV4XPE7_CAEEX|nr:hypothetical protein CEXT_55311 [Caerostris extrusa]